MLILEVQNPVEVQTSKERVELWLAQLFIDNGEARLNCGWLSFSSTTSKAKVELWLAKLFIDNVKARVELWLAHLFIDKG
jgi:hypothetical protein